LRSNVAGARIRIESGVDHATTGHGAGRRCGATGDLIHADLEDHVGGAARRFSKKSVHTLPGPIRYCGDVFIFRSKRSDRVKLLAWGRQRHGSGDEVAPTEGRFAWPPIRDGVVSLTATQLSMLIDGSGLDACDSKAVKRPVGMM